MAASSWSNFRCEPAVVEDRRIIRIKPDRPVEILDSVVPLLLPAVGDAAIVEGCGIVGSDLQGSGVILDGPIPFSLRAVGSTAKRKSDSQMAIEFYRSIEVLNGAVELAAPLPSGATVGES